MTVPVFATHARKASQPSGREGVLYNRTVLGFATKMRKRVRHFDENTATPQVGSVPFAMNFENLHSCRFPN
jgi:hypothetical protein